MTEKDANGRKNTQLMLFTATYCELLIMKYFDTSIFTKIEINDKNTNITQFYVLAPFKYKINYLYELCRNLQRCVIFVQKVFHSVLLSNFLRELNLNVRFINGRMTQKDKNEIIRAFKNDDFNILITTDILSRGIDIPLVENIINYNVPTSYKEYTHRIGRTARMYANGQAITIITQYDLESLQRIEAMLGEKMTEYEIDKDSVYSNRAKICNIFDSAQKKSKLEVANYKKNIKRIKN